MVDPAVERNNVVPLVAPGVQTTNYGTSVTRWLLHRHIDVITVQGDSEREMWAMYMTEVKEHDERIAGAWKEDATALVVFVGPNLSILPSAVMTTSKTGLFAAVVAAFIIESYKKLSPDTGDETVVLLRQISRQLTGFTNGTSPTQATTNSPSPGALIVCVNVLWLTSLVLSIASALFATLLQQWARRYIQKPQIQREPSKRARIRSFLNLGTVKFKMRPVVEIAPTILHLAVLLFFVGLGMFFVPIHKTVGIIISVVVGLFGLAYLALTILPCIKHNCPYRTPMTVLFWYSWHTVLFYAARFFRWAVRRLHDSLVGDNLDDEISPMQELLVKWLQSREGAVERHMGCLEHGLDKSSIENAPGDEDRRTLSWLLNFLALVDKSKLRNFVASIPRNTIAQLMTPPIESGAMVLREPLLTLVRGYAGTTAVGPDEPLRRRSLFVCLEAVRLVAEASIDPNAVPEEVLRDIRINFANINLMRAMCADDDAAIRLTSRSTCALLARSLIHRGELDRPELTWLQDVTEATANAISNSPITDLYHINRKSFVCGVLSAPMSDLPTEHVASFERTLAILMGAVTQADSDIDRTVLGTELHTFFQWMEADGHVDNSVVSTLHRMYQSIT
jgi:hypothetical protein